MPNIPNSQKKRINVKFCGQSSQAIVKHCQVDFLCLKVAKKYKYLLYMYSHFINSVLIDGLIHAQVSSNYNTMIYQGRGL
mgnify:CR=1 FL=1